LSGINASSLFYFGISDEEEIKSFKTFFEETKRVVELAERIESEFKERRKLNRKTKPKNPETGNGTDEAKPEVKTKPETGNGTDEANPEVKTKPKIPETGNGTDEAKPEVKTKPETGNGTDEVKPEVKTESDDLKNDCLKTENGDESFPGKRSACDDQGPML
jgi:hypothetical protein